MAQTGFKHYRPLLTILRNKKLVFLFLNQNLLWVLKKSFLTYVWGTQKNRVIEMFRLSTNNICFG